MAKDLKVGRFVSRATDSITLRVGRNGVRSFRYVLLADLSRFVCLVEMDVNSLDADNEVKVEKLMSVLEDGAQYREMKKDLDLALAIIFGEYPKSDERYEIALAIAKKHGIDVSDF